MKKLKTILLGASAALVCGFSGVQAAPTGMLGAGDGARGDDSVIKVHGWHYECAPGPGGRWHRHAPGAGWIPCGPRPGYGPPAYYPPRPTYRSRREDFCAVVYNQCYAQFGRGTAPYYACMRSRNC